MTTSQDKILQYAKKSQDKGQGRQIWYAEKSELYRIDLDYGNDNRE